MLVKETIPEAIERLCDVQQEAQYSPASQPFEAPPRTIGCDQVAWILDIMERHRQAQTVKQVGISQIDLASDVAALLELMEVLRLRFEDEASQDNAVARLIPQYLRSRAKA